MLRITSFLIGFLTFVCFCGETKADLALVLDTSSQTLYFTGSESGISANLDSWIIGNLESGTPPSDTSIIFANTSGLFSLSPTGIALELFSGTPNEPFTYTAAGMDEPIDYGNIFNAAEISFLESQIGDSLTPFNSSEFGNINIVSAVPEPTSAVVLCSALAVLATRRKRS